LREEIERGCNRQVEWEARVAVGIRTALEFAAVSEADMRVLTVEARPERQDEMIAYFTKLLVEGAPPERRLPIYTDRAVVELIAAVVRSRLLADSADLLPRLAPELAYLTLMPHTGLAGARRGAERAERSIEVRSGTDLPA
jgi:hypothetical protein